MERRPAGLIVARPPTKRAEAAAEARRHLLEVGREMVFEQPVNAGLEHIKVKDVAGRAGMTTGAIYHHWETQDHYRSELMDVLLTPVDLQDEQLLAAVYQLTQEGVLSLDDLIDLAAWDAIQQLAVDQLFSVQIGFWSRRSEPEILRRLSARNDELTRRRRLVFEGFLQLVKRELKPNVTVDDFASVLNALLEGMALRHAIDAAVFPISFPRLSGGLAAADRLRGIAGDRVPRAEVIAEQYASAGERPLVYRCYAALVDELTVVA